MALVFSYDPTLPDDRDWVRFYVGDVNAAQPELDDQEIDALLADADIPEADDLGNPPTAAQWRSYRLQVASRAAEGLAAKHARDVDRSIDGQSVGSSVRASQYRDLSARLRSQAVQSHPMRVERW